MLLFPGLIAVAAAQAGIKVPKNPDEDFDVEEYPHFTVFCTAQLARPMTSPSEHWHNAEVIATISDKDIKTITPKGLVEKGFLGIS